MYNDQNNQQISSPSPSVATVLISRHGGKQLLHEGWAAQNQVKAVLPQSNFVPPGFRAPANSTFFIIGIISKVVQNHV